MILCGVALGTELDLTPTKLSEMHRAQLHDLSDVTVFTLHPEATLRKVLTYPLVFLIAWVCHSAKDTLRTGNLLTKNVAA